MSDEKMPTGIELWHDWEAHKGNAEESCVYLFKRGAEWERARREKARGPRPENPWNDATFSCRQWEAGFQKCLAWADSGAPESPPAPADGELVERRLARACRAAWEERARQFEPGEDPWLSVARAVLVELAKSDETKWLASLTRNNALAHDLTRARERIADLEAARSNDDRDHRASVATIATLEQENRELKSERDSLRRDIKAELDGNTELRIAYGAKPQETFRQFIARLARADGDLATAREQHRVELERVQEALRYRESDHLGTCADLVQLKTELAARDEELGLLRMVESDANAALEQGQQLSPDPHYRWASLEKLDAHREKLKGASCSVGLAKGDSAGAAPSGSVVDGPTQPDAPGSLRPGDKGYEWKPNPEIAGERAEGWLQRGVDSAAEYMSTQPQWKKDAAAKDFPIGALDDRPPVGFGCVYCSSEPDALPPCSCSHAPCVHDENRRRANDGPPRVGDTVDTVAVGERKVLDVDVARRRVKLECQTVGDYWHSFEGCAIIRRAPQPAPDAPILCGCGKPLSIGAQCHNCCVINIAGKRAVGLEALEARLGAVEEFLEQTTPMLAVNGRLAEPFRRGSK
jgi:hypothetical protein